jgi:hypothetical protein
MAVLDVWDSFYVIVGSAAGALIGLQFVVMTLMAERPSSRVAEANAAFGTPTVVHFAAALLLSVLLRVPWPSVNYAAIACGSVGAAGLIYALIVTRRMRVQAAYAPDFEDWLCHGIMPPLGYSLLIVSAVCAVSHLSAALFGIAGGALLLLFLGIHNAWDSVAFAALFARNREQR